MLRRVFCVLLAAMLPALAVAETVTIPFGTVVFCELDERVTSKKKDGSGEGDIVRVRVWKDVWADNRVVIEAGTPVYARISEIRKAKMAGRKGILEIEALNVTAVNGRDVALDGGYDKSGKGKVGLTIALAAVIAWPLIFMKGKNAVLEPGTIFDAIVRSAVDLELESESPRRPIKMESSLDVVVLYDDMDPDSKIKELPLELRLSGGPIRSAAVVSVNGKSIPGIPIQLAGPGGEGVRGTVDFKALSKNFVPGMNQFEVEAGGETAVVLLEIEF